MEVCEHVGVGIMHGRTGGGAEGALTPRGLSSKINLFSMKLGMQYCNNGYERYEQNIMNI